MVGANQCGRENDSVECCIVLAHKLVELYLVRILPPLFPIVIVSTKIVSGN